MKHNFFVLVGLFALTSFSHAGDKPEAKYCGKPLSYWIQRIEKAESGREQLEAAQAIMAFGKDAAPVVPKLIEMLSDRSDEFRSRIAEVLIDLGPNAKAAAPALLRMLKEKQTQDPKLIIAIVAKVDPEAKELVPILISSMEDPNLASDAIDALRELGPRSKDAVPALITSLKNRKLAKEATEALYAMGPAAKDAVAVIARRLRKVKTQFDKSDRSDNTNWRAELFEPLGNLHMFGPAAIPALVEFLKEDAVQREDSIAYERHTPDLFWIEQTKQPCQCSAALALGQMGPRAASASVALRKTLESENIALKLCACEALWKIEKDPALIRMLVGNLDKDVNFAYGAVSLLGSFGPEAKAALPDLRKVLERKGKDPLKDHLEDTIRAAIRKIDVEMEEKD